MRVEIDLRIGQNRAELVHAVGRVTPSQIPGEILGLLGNQHGSLTLPDSDAFWRTRTTGTAPPASPRGRPEVPSPHPRDPRKYVRARGVHCVVLSGGGEA